MVYVGEGILQLFSLMFFVLLMIGLGLLASRMMGVPFSVPRLLLAGLAGLMLGSAVGALLYYGSVERLVEESPFTTPTPGYVVVVLAMGVRDVRTSGALDGDGSGLDADLDYTQNVSTTLIQRRRTQRRLQSLPHPSLFTRSNTL
jgi:hypothetical protein